MMNLTDILARQAHNHTTDIMTRLNNLQKYGVARVLGASSPTLTRIWGSTARVATVPIDDAFVQDDFLDIFPFNRARECKITSSGILYKGDPGYDVAVGDWMTEVPKTYISKTRDATTGLKGISEFAQPGFYLPYCFKDDNGNELPYVYIARFKTGKDGATDVSRPDLVAESWRTIDSFRQAARSKGAGWQLYDIHAVDLIKTLYDVKYASLNSQAIFGDGLTAYRYSASDIAQIAETAVNRIILLNASADAFVVGQQVCFGSSAGDPAIAKNRTITAINVYDGTRKEVVFDGATINVALTTIMWSGPQKTGQTKNLTKLDGKLSGTAGKKSFKFLGLEDLYGNVLEWIDGCMINERVAQVCRKSGSYASALNADYSPVGYTNAATDGYPFEMGYDANYPEAQFPTTVGAGTTTGYCDYYYQTTGLRVLALGGHSRSGSAAGLSCWGLNDAPSLSSWYFGSRLLFKPPV